MKTYTDFFKNPTKIFDRYHKSANEIMEDCIYILDTNVLLLPYSAGNKEINEIKRVYEVLIEQNKLFIPSQVVKEFVKNRPNKMKDMVHSISDYMSKVREFKSPKYPMFSQLEEFSSISVKEEELNNLIKEYKKELKKSLNYIRGLNWNDQVSKIYSDLFTENTIIEFEWKHDEIKTELEVRNKFNIPPAYKDKGKDDGGIGDFIIWKDILKFGLENKYNIIFVTGDEKADWFHQAMNSKLYPRYELIHEFKEITDGNDIYFISLADLIDLYSIDKQVVDNIRSVENKIRIAPRNRRNPKNSKLARMILPNECNICGAQFEDNNVLDVHHLIPLSQGGEDKIENMVLLCPNCHKQVHKRFRNSQNSNYDSNCEMSGQLCPTCKIGVLQRKDNGFECSKCQLYIPD